MEGIKGDKKKAKLSLKEKRQKKREKKLQKSQHIVDAVRDVYEE